MIHLLSRLQKKQVSVFEFQQLQYAVPSRFLIPGAQIHG